GVQGVKRPLLPRRSVVLIGWGQGFASPVLPFAGKVDRFPDKPGARPLTFPFLAFNPSSRRRVRQVVKWSVGLLHTSCPSKLFHDP
ncbi:hypothetical protein C7A07_27015, partial [Pseudomonas fragi]